MPDLAPEVQELIGRTDAMMARVQAAGPAGGGTVEGMRAAADAAIAELFVEAGGELPEVARVEDHRFPVAGGEIVVRAYTPEGDGPFPAYLHVHGGAWIMGSIDWPTFASYAREVANRTPCVVVDVEYRLAPEFPFPTAIEDSYAALEWLRANAASLGVDRSRIAVGGDSAGGNIAAAVCLKALAEGGPPIAFQLLEMPAPDHAHLEDYASAREFGAGYGLEVEGLVQGRAFYFTDPEDASDPYASPLLAEDLSGLPPTHILTAEFDPLRDSGEAYGGRLQEAGVPTVVSRQVGHVHGSSLLLHPRWEPARTWRDEVILALRAALVDVTAHA
jgi:acetyl esterase